MKNKILFVLLMTQVSFFSFAETYNFKNDYLYKDILTEYNIIAKNWCVAEKNKIPAKLLQFKVLESELLKAENDKTEQVYLVPLEVFEFRDAGIFNFYWMKNYSEAGTISGKWDIDNSTLMLTFSKDYIDPYLKGKQMRYEIIGTDQLKTKLFFKGKTYSSLTEIIDTSNDMFKDFEDIIIKMDQKEVSVRFPKIIKAKELQLKESLLKSNK